MQIKKDPEKISSILKAIMARENIKNKIENISKRKVKQKDTENNNKINY